MLITAILPWHPYKTKSINSVLALCSLVEKSTKTTMLWYMPIIANTANRCRSQYGWSFPSKVSIQAVRCDGGHQQQSSKAIAITKPVGER
jgi:hypothetical protein